MEVMVAVQSGFLLRVLFARYLRVIYVCHTRGKNR